MILIKTVIEKHAPYADDILKVEDEFGNEYRITGDELQEYLVQEGKMCGECFGYGEVQEGEYDNIISKKCKCKNTSEMDDDS